MMEKQSHALTQAKNTMLLVKANKWEAETINKEQKLSKSIDNLNDNLKLFEELGKAHRKLEAKVGSYSYELDDTKDKDACDQEKV